MSQYIVSARKYRPLKFSEVVGQDHVTDTLRSALKKDQLAHAFLFCGPRGVGKTTCARILAKALNCSNPDEDREPCNECESCRSFNQNSSFNMLELDAASHNSVDHMRSLVEQVRFQPQQGKYKVFIIDEVHMLSTQAFNAFLKTLEEPPPYAFFILATTEKHKIIPTIMSRCQIYDFKRISVGNIVNQLQHIGKKEGIETDEAALHIIAQKADGALRDALSIFDKIAGLGNKKVSYEDVITHLNVMDYDYFFKVVDHLLLEDLSGVMRVFDQVLANGFDGGQFILGLAQHMRELMMCKQAGTHELLEVSGELKEKYLEQANACSLSFLLSCLELANECDLNYQAADNKRLLVELSLAKMNYLQRRIEGQSPAVVEKKRPEQKRPTVKKNKPEASKPVKQEKKKSKKEPEPAKTENKKEEAGPEEEPEEKSAKKQSLNAPPVGDLSGFAERVARKKAKDTKVDQPELNLENLAVAFKKNLASVKSNVSRNYLKKVHFQIEEKEIRILVGTELARSALLQEKELRQALRSHFQLKNRSISIEIDPSLAPDLTKTRKKTLTNKEKYEMLKEENPLVDELIKQLDLRFDK